MKWIIFYNENFRESFRSRRISFHESIETLTKRLLFAAINYLAEKYEVVPVIIAEKDDPYYAFNMDSQIQIITFQEFLYKLNIGDQISSVLENYQLLSIAQDQSLVRDRYSPYLTALRSKSDKGKGYFLPIFQGRKLKLASTPESCMLGYSRFQSFLLSMGKFV